MVVSLFIQVVGCLLFVPAAKMVGFPLFLTAVFMVGAGVTALQTAANPYVAILGPEHSAPVRLNLAQALNSLGGTIAPWVAGVCLTAAVLHPDRSLAERRGPARIPGRHCGYGARTLHRHRGGLVILGIAVMFMHLPHIHADAGIPARLKKAIRSLSRSIWSYRHTVLGAIGIFVYVGVEVGLASIMRSTYFKTQGWAA